DVTRNIGDFYLYDFARETWNRFTTDGNTTFLLWRPEGTRLTLGTLSDSQYRISSRSLDGSVPEEKRFADSPATYPLPWSPDGEYLAIVPVDTATSQDISILDRRNPQKPEPFLAKKEREGAPMFSPDGKWIAYVSDKSGQLEIYLRPFPGP